MFVFSSFCVDSMHFTAESCVTLSVLIWHTGFHSEVDSFFSSSQKLSVSPDTHLLAGWLVQYFNPRKQPSYNATIKNPMIYTCRQDRREGEKEKME